MGGGNRRIRSETSEAEEQSVKSINQSINQKAFKEALVVKEVAMGNSDGPINGTEAKQDTKSVRRRRKVGDVKSSLLREQGSEHAIGPRCRQQKSGCKRMNEVDEDEHGENVGIQSGQGDRKSGGRDHCPFGGVSTSPAERRAMSAGRDGGDNAYPRGWRWVRRRGCVHCQRAQIREMTDKGDALRSVFGTARGQQGGRQEERVKEEYWEKRATGRRD